LLIILNKKSGDSKNESQDFLFKIISKKMNLKISCSRLLAKNEYQDFLFKIISKKNESQDFLFKIISKKRISRFLIANNLE
jgi:hypothetical protein